MTVREYMLCIVNELECALTGCTLKMLQLLQQYEHLALHLAQAVELIVNTFGVKGIVSEIMRYIFRLLFIVVIKYVTLFALSLHTMNHWLMADNMIAFSAVHYFFNLITFLI